MSGSTATVFSFVNKKDEYGNFSPLYLSPEQRYIKPTRSSNNNNLEEQLLLGTDRIITSWQEDEVTYREHIEFRPIDDDLSTDYYILDSYIYNYNIGDDSSTSYDLEVIIDDDYLIFEKSGYCSIDGDILVDDKGEGFMSYIDAEKTILFFPLYMIRKDILTFKQSSGTILDVSQKITTTNSDDEGRTYVKEIITNFL